MTEPTAPEPTAPERATPGPAAPEPAVILLVPPSLRLFLPAGRRAERVPVRCDETSTLGHLVSSAGIPPTEVGGLLLADRPVGPGHRPAGGDEVRVLPVTYPQPAPTSPPRFLLDVHLGTLARRMRLLGLDTAYRSDADDDQLARQSAQQQRILLTRDRRLLHRRAVRWGAHLRQDAPDDQLAEVLDRFRPPLDPWTRCPACNGSLREVGRSEVEPLLQPGTRRSYADFRRCTGCGRVYWRGAHAARLRGIVDAALTRARPADPA
ncbi:MAG TPA: Mut7-C RNAse domain-containing protein [Kineosporiaceae bacterium]|nr:Mut7-C RNAse domain-containing protein [Kineosporiaceae bacterium]